MEDHVRFSGTKYEKGNNIILVISENCSKMRGRTPSPPRLYRNRIVSLASLYVYYILSYSILKLKKKLCNTSNFIGKNAHVLEKDMGLCRCELFRNQSVVNTYLCVVNTYLSVVNTYLFRNHRRHTKNLAPYYI